MVEVVFGECGWVWGVYSFYLWLYFVFVCFWVVSGFVGCLGVF